MGSCGICIELPGLFRGACVRWLMFFHAHLPLARADDKNVLEPFSFTEDKRKEVRDNIEERVRLLENEHVSFFCVHAFGHVWTIVGNTVRRYPQGCLSQRRNTHVGDKRFCGKLLAMSVPLDTILIFHHESCASVTAPQTPLSRLPATEPEALAAALGKFSLWLSTPDVISSPRLFPLSSSLLAGQVHRGALRRLVRAYSALCEEVRAESARGKFVAGSVVLGRERPFGQVELLRQIFGLEPEEDDAP